MTKKTGREGKLGERDKHGGVGKAVDKVRKTERDKESKGRRKGKRYVIKKP